MRLFQVITNYYDRVLQLAQLLGPEIFGTVAQKALGAGDEALKRLMETFNIVDSDRFALGEEGLGGQSNADSNNGIGGDSVSPGANRLAQPAGPNGTGGIN